MLKRPSFAVSTYFYSISTSWLKTEDATEFLLCVEYLEF